MKQILIHVMANLRESATYEKSYDKKYHLLKFVFSILLN